MFDRVIEINRFVHPLRVQAQRLDQLPHPVPNPMRSVGDKQHLIGLFESQALQVPAQWCVDQWRETLFQLPFFIDHVYDEQLQLTPSPVVARV